MFCSKCGNKLPDNIRFCNSCGAAVRQEAPPQPKPVPQPKPEQKVKKPKKSRAGLVLNLVFGGILLLSVIGIVLLLLFGGQGGTALPEPTGESIPWQIPGGEVYPGEQMPAQAEEAAHPVNGWVAYDGEYTYFLYDNGADERHIMRKSIDPDELPMSIYAEPYEDRGYGYGPTFAGLFMCEDKLAFFHIAGYTAQTDELELELRQLSTDGNHLDHLCSIQGSFGPEHLYYFDGYLSLGDSSRPITFDVSARQNSPFHELLRLDLQDYCFLTWMDGCCYYMKEQQLTGDMAELYRMAPGGAEQCIGAIPYPRTLDIYSFTPKGDWIYFRQDGTILRIHHETGEQQGLASSYTNFVITENYLYYCNNKGLCRIELATLTQSYFATPESWNSAADLLMPGAGDSCWIMVDEDRSSYWHFTAQGGTGSYTCLERMDDTDRASTVWVPEQFAPSQTTGEESAPTQPPSLEDYEGLWVWEGETGPEADLYLKLREGNMLVGDLSIYRLISEEVSLIELGDVVVVSSDSGIFQGNAILTQDRILLLLQDNVICDGSTLSQLLGTTEFRFVRDDA